MMRFLVDECTGPAVARWLKNNEHDVFSVYDQAPGIKDDEVIHRAYNENRILITNDKDFGEKVYRGQHPHKGVIFLRLVNERSMKKIEVLQRLLGNYSDRLQGQFVVVTEKQVWFAKL
jgi:predicted nuclease of predicted toxin-antitoxin system